VEGRARSAIRRDRRRENTANARSNRVERDGRFNQKMGCPLERIGGWGWQRGGGVRTHGNGPLHLKKLKEKYFHIIQALDRAEL